MPSRVRRLVLSFPALAGLTALVLLLLGLRAALGHAGQTFLIWNLFLAWLPYAAARAMQVLDRRGWTRGGLLLVGAFWLAFLPNAPYLVTDPVHLAIGSQSPHRLAFDAVLFGVVALLGLLLGVASLALVHELVERRLGPAVGWTFVTTVSLATAFGVYLGRVARWNSWAVATDPRPLLSDIHYRLNVAGPRMTLGVVVFAVCFLVAYVMLRPGRSTRPRSAARSSG
jgi:uncharacterized membrane protein